MKTIESSSITSLLLLLDSDNLSEKAKEMGINSPELEAKVAISNIVATETEKIIDGSEQARTLFNAEKKLISERGNDINKYLSRNEISVKDVLEAYYHGVVDRNNFRRLSGNYSISEMMLMLGTFMHLMEARTTSLATVKGNAMKFKIAKMVQRVTRKDKTLSESQREEMKFLDDLLSNSKVWEERMLEYMMSQTDVVMKAILERLGSNIGLAPKKQLEEICFSSHELCTASSVMDSYFSERTKTVPMVAMDVALFDSCGERSPQLYSVMDMGTDNSKEKQKRA